MPTPMVAPARPRSSAASRLSLYDPSTDDASFDDGPQLLSYEEAVAARRNTDLRLASDTVRLMREAADLARRFGCEIRQRCLGGVGGGCRWVDGRRRVVLDLDSPAATRLSVLADALRGEPRLPFTPMSQELAEYLRPTRAA